MSRVISPFVAACPQASAPARATAHACLRYAQRVLGLDIDHRQLAHARDLFGRCERGIARLAQRASRCGSGEGDAEIWITGTRALVVRDGHVLTVLVARDSRGFGKQFLRRCKRAAVAA